MDGWLFTLCSVPVKHTCCVTRCPFLFLVKAKASPGGDRTHRPHGRVTHNLIINVMEAHAMYEGVCMKNLVDSRQPQ